jgi:hypothetical protein
MANKRFLMVVLVMTLVFGMGLVSCGDNDSGEDTWLAVTSLAQINGTWKGPFSETQVGEGLTVKLVGDMTITINASARTLSGSVKYTATYSGGDIDLYWPYIKESAIAEGYTVSDSNHSVKGTQTIPSQSITLSDFDEWQINQKGNKLKPPADEFGSTVFTKQ